MCSSITTYPLDFVKTARQIQLQGHKDLIAFETPFKSSTEVLKACWRANSLPGIMYGARIHAIQRFMQVFVRNEFFD
eukprot:UN03433